MGLEIKDGLIAVDGSTFGNLQHDGSVLKLLNSSGKTVVDIPLQCVSSANLVDGREIVLEMHKFDESRTEECLMDIRFVLGTDESALKQAKATHDSILELANLRQFTGELVTSLADIKMVVPGPRGKFSLDLYKNFFKIKDKSGEFDKNVSYDDISYMFMLNKVAAGGLQRTFVVGLDPPVRKGSSMYANLVFLMDEEERISLFIEMPESERKELGLPKNCAGFASDVVVEVFEKLTAPCGKKIHSCNDNSTFRKAWAAEHPAEQDVDCFKASISADIGSLYPLEKCLLFLEKPPTYIPIKDISSVSFKKPDVKLASTTSGFDLIVKRNNGQKTTFSQIAKKSVEKVLHDMQYLVFEGFLSLIFLHQPLMSWIIAKKISIEVLKETRPEKELSSDSEESSVGGGMSSDPLSSKLFSMLFVQILIPMPMLRSRVMPKPVQPMLTRMTLILKTTKTTKPMTNLPAVEVLLPDNRSCSKFVVRISSTFSVTPSLALAVAAVGTL